MPLARLSGMLTVRLTSYLLAPPPMPLAMPLAVRKPMSSALIPWAAVEEFLRAAEVAGQ